MRRSLRRAACTPAALVFASATLACGPRAAGNEDGPPVADPGGPFQTDVDAGARLTSLAYADQQALCMTLGQAYYTFLNGVVQATQWCREVGGQSASESLADAGSAPPPSVHRRTTSA